MHNFYTATQGKTPEERAHALEAMEDFKKVHGSFACQGQSAVPDSTENVNHHFIAFIKTEDGRLVELDGMKQGPVVVKEACEDLLKETAQVLLKRVEEGKYSESIGVQVLCKKPEE